MLKSVLNKHAIISGSSCSNLEDYRPRLSTTFQYNKSKLTEVIITIQPVGSDITALKRISYSAEFNGYTGI